MAISPLSFDAALAAILETAPLLPARDIPLAHAAGRTLAAPLIAARDQPPTPLSAMDGYAVRAADLLDGQPLTIDGATPAGAEAGPALSPRTARRIFTGAPLPESADAVLIQEQAGVDGTKMRPQTTVPPGTYVRPKGFDFSAGETLLPAGQRLGPRALGLCAAANQAYVSVRRTPRLAILATGAELRAPGQAHAPEHVVASNGLTLATLLSAEDRGFVGDDVAAIAAEIDASLKGGKDGCDMLITTGGASVGDHDLVQSALASLGGTRTFWQVMMRPGKPVFLWDVRGTPVLGLPGNPVSAYVCARVLALPWVKKALGHARPLEPRVPLPLATPLAANGPRHQFARASLSDQGLVAAPSQDSSLLRTLATADYLIERAPHARALAMGEMVTALKL